MFIFNRTRLPIATAASLSTLTICATIAGASSIHFGPGPNSHIQATSALHSVPVAVSTHNLARTEASIEARTLIRTANLASLRATELHGASVSRQLLLPSLAAMDREQREDASAVKEQVRSEILAVRAEQTPAAHDEVSAAIRDLFGTYGNHYQQLSAEAAAFHNQFVQALTAGAEAYADAETHNDLTGHEALLP
jgi:hypothetical protein